MRARPLRSALAQMLRRCQARAELAAGAHFGEDWASNAPHTSKYPYVGPACMHHTPHQSKQSHVKNGFLSASLAPVRGVHHA